MCLYLDGNSEEQNEAALEETSKYVLNFAPVARPSLSWTTTT